MATATDPVCGIAVDPRNEAAVQQRWQRLCEQYGAAILGIRDVLTSLLLVKMHGIVWELAPLGSGEREVPAEVFHRWRALEAGAVPFAY